MSEQPRKIDLPWKKSGPDEVATNFAIGSLRESLLQWLKDGRGVHAETLMVVIGTLAGFAAQSAAWARIRKRDVPSVPGTEAASIVDNSEGSVADFGEYLRRSGLFLQSVSKSGERFYWGDLINGYLVPQPTSPYSLWGFVAAAALEAGVPKSELPDYREMFRYVAGTVGRPEFGMPRSPVNHRPALLPRKALEIFWPRARYIFDRTDGPGPAKGHSVAPEYWPIAIALVAQQFVRFSKETLDPRLAVSLVMESAIAMSKVDPNKVPQKLPNQSQTEHLDTTSRPVP